MPWVWSRWVCKYCLVLNIFPQTWHGSQKSFVVWTLAMCCFRLLLVLYTRPHSGQIGFCCWWRSPRGEPPSSDTGPGSPGHVHQFEHLLYLLLLSPKGLDTIPISMEIIYIQIIVTTSVEISFLPVTLVKLHSISFLINKIYLKQHIIIITSLVFIFSTS